MDVSSDPKPQSPPATFLDRLGGRFVVRDRTGANVEILVFANELVSAPGFEAALKDTVSRLTDFRHPSVRRVRGLARLAEPDNRLALVSDLTPGSRLSELLYAAEQDRRQIETRAALFVVQELLAATAALHQAVPGAAHGAIGPERVLITPEGRVLLVEHTLGAALECHAALPSERLWKDYRLPVPDGPAPRFTERTDVVQIGLVFLSLLLGRLLRRDEFPRRISELLLAVDETGPSGERSQLGLGLRAWLLRTLQVSSQDSYAAADEARTAFGYLLSTESDYTPEPTGALTLLPITEPMPAAQLPPGPAQPTRGEAPRSEPSAAVETGVTPGEPIADKAAALDRQPVTSGTPQTPAATPSEQAPGIPPAAAPATPVSAHPPSIPAAAAATADQPIARAVPPATAASMPEAVTARPKSHDGSTPGITSSVTKAAPLVTADHPAPVPPTPTIGQRDAPHDGSPSRPAQAPGHPVTSHPASGPAPAGILPSDLGAPAQEQDTAARPLSAEDLEFPPGVGCVAQDVHWVASNSDRPAATPAHAAAARPRAIPSVASITASPAHSRDRALFGATEATTWWSAWWSWLWLARRWLMVGAGALGLIVVAVVIGARLLSGSATPRPVTGTLKVDSRPPGAEVFVDGKPRGRTPLSIDLAAGDHRLEVGSRSNPRVIPVSIAAGARVQQYVELPEVAQRGELRVVSEPPGARVVVDGTERGVAPITVTDLTPGEHSVALEGKAGTVKQQVTVVSGATSSLVVPLGAAEVPQGWIAVTAPVPMQLFENGRPLGTSQGDAIAVPAGRHAIELVNTTVGYRETRSIDVAAGKMMRVTIEMPSATLSLNAVPWAEVFIDGRKVGDTPLGALMLPAGPHEVVFRHPQFGEQRQTVVVKLPGPNRLSVDLRK
jgi:hypothetical protein